MGIDTIDTPDSWIRPVRELSRAGRALADQGPRQRYPSLSALGSIGSAYWASRIQPIPADVTQSRARARADSTDELETGFYTLAMQCVAWHGKVELRS